MSELKAINAYQLTTNTEDSDVYIHNDEFGCGGDLVECYLKSEADKVIADLKQKMKQQDVLLGKALNTISESHKHVVSLARKCNHANYKRCLAMARYCRSVWSAIIFIHEGHGAEHYMKWERRWRDLAVKFKEAK